MNSIKKLAMFAVTCAALTVLNSKVETKASMTNDKYTSDGETTNKSDNNNNNSLDNNNNNSLENNLENNNNNNIKNADSNYNYPYPSSSTYDNSTSTASNPSKTSSTNDTKKSDTALTTKDTFNNEFDKIEQKANDSIKQILSRNMLLAPFFSDINFSGSDNEKSASRSVNESSYTDENGNKNTTKIIRQSRRKTETDKDGAINEIVETKTVRKTSLTQEDKNS